MLFTHLVLIELRDQCCCLTTRKSSEIQDWGLEVDFVGVIVQTSVTQEILVLCIRVL